MKKQSTIFGLVGLICVVMNTTLLSFHLVAQPTVLLAEGFEGGTAMPAGWTQEQVVGTTLWQSVTAATGTPATAHSGSYKARFYNSAGHRTHLITPVINFTGYTENAQLKFWHTQRNWAGDQDVLRVWYRTSAANPWVQLAEYTTDVFDWTERVIPLPNVNATYQIAFDATGNWGYGVQLDDIEVTGEPPVQGVPMTVQIGEGTVTSNYPFTTYWHDGRTQMIYTAQDLANAGALPGELVQIAFNVISFSSQPMNGFSVKVQHTTLTAIPTAFVGTNWTEVYFGIYTVLGTGWRDISFQNPFVWDGVSNLMFEICYDNTSWTSYSPVYAHSTPVAMMRGQYTDGAVGCALSAGTNFTYRPNIRMTFLVPPGTIQGVVADAFTGSPLTGAVVSVGEFTAVTLGNGAYSINLPAGSVQINCSKVGYDNQVVNAFVNAGETVTVNIAMYENTNPPGAVFASLNAAQTAVNLVWGAPTGLYEIIYDDGTPENLVAWSTAGNINALRFTAMAYPVHIVGGSVHIGDGSYPPSQNNLKPFEIAIFNQDATPFGWPNQELARIDVNPTAWGWVSFTFDTPIEISSGDFYIGMVQGGNYPACAPIAVDENSVGMRSYSRFVSGNGPWTISGYQNFMIRAIVNGPGGPWPTVAGNQFVEAQRPHRELLSMIPARPIKGGYTSEASYAPLSTTLQPKPETENVVAFRIESAAASKMQKITLESGICVDEPGQGAVISLAPNTASSDSRSVLFNNGPLVNSPGTGAGGADESVIVAPINTFGFHFGQVAGYHVADDFTVTGDQPWSISSVELFGYQTGGPITSTMTGGFIRIWNGDPRLPGSAIVWGDMTTNLMSGTSFTNIYRTNAIGQNIVNRPIMKVVCNTMGLVLDPGTYWIEFATTGSLASGPWVPPVTISGQPITGNAIQWIGTGWAELFSGTTYPQGVPFILNGAALSDLEYMVYRLEQGQEGTPSTWVDLGMNPSSAYTDTSWPTLSDGAYRWAVRAKYTGDRLSEPTFSNVLGKGFTVDAVTFNLSLSSGATPSGIEVVMVNQLVPDSTYATLSGDNGIVVFNNVWKGTYHITVYKFGFELWTTTETLTANKTYNIMLWQLKNPPTGLYVDNRSLLATWNRPVMQALIFEETFSSGNFTFNNWGVECSNWTVAFFGNPSPSAQFYYSPTLTNYSCAITSKLLTGVGSPEVFLYFDIYLSNFSQTTIEKMAAEVWDGADWIPVKTFDNTVGSIPWTSNTIDITEHVSGDFRVRFRAYGDDSYQINNWNIDNVRVLGVETDFSVMGYNFYIDDLQIAFATETELQIPPALINYGQTYLAEVSSVYQSGVSQRNGYTFTSYWLAAPWNLAGVNVENAVQLTWEAPFIPPVTVLSSEPRTEMPDPNTEYSPMSVEFEYADSRDLFDPLFSFPHFDAGGEYPVATDGNFIYTARWNAGDFFRYNMDGTYVGSFTIAGAGNFRDLTYDGQYFYGSNNSSTIYKLDLANQTLVSSFSTSVATIRAIAYDAVNDGFWVSNGWNPPLTLVSRTGATMQTLNPPTATSFAGLGWENVSEGGPFLWGYCQTGPGNDLVKIDMTTGATLQVFNVGSVFTFTSSAGGLDITPLVVSGKMVFLGAAQNDKVWVLELGDYAGTGPIAGGILGYNIYRNGSLHSFVEVPELEFWDLNMMPGTYKYSATAVYDLTYFGLTGTDESLHSNEIEIGVNNFGYPLPFVEEWTSANFGFNNWVVTDGDPHWRVTTAQGNPVPAAEFTWSPPVKEYWYAITSPALNAAPYTCADIFLEFDIKLNDRNATQDEKLIVQHYVNGNWVPLKEFKNNGSFNWTHESIQMPLATGKTFHVRFVATGKNTADILSWFIDNIHVYAACRAPMDLMGNQVNWEPKAYLEWVEPDCESGPSGQLVKLSQWNGGPDNGYFQSFNMAYGVVYDLASYPDATLELVDFHHASWGTLGTWDYKIHVVNWNTYQLIETFGPFQTTGNDKWENGIQIGQLMGYGGGLVGIMLEPLGNVPTDAYPCFSADNIGPNGVSLFGNIPNWSAFAVSGIGDFLQNLWIRTNFAKDGGLVKLAPVTAGELAAETRMPVNKSEAGELAQNSKLIPSFDNATKDSPVQGYNVYRSDDLGATFNVITPAPITTLNYTDLDVVFNGEYHYYVTAMYDVCESVQSNIVPVSIGVGIDELDTDAISIYPIPATTQLNINVTNDVRSMRIMNYMGQVVFEQATVKDKLITVNTSNFAPGAYMVQLVNEAGQTITRRVAITR